MSRPLRIEYPGAVYHVMNRGGARQKTFLYKEDYESFLNTLSETHELWGIEVLAYCLMNNHYHLCLRTPEGNLSRVMRHLDGLYTQRFNRAHRRDGALFRGRYKAILIDADEYLTTVVRYIHLNPVEAGLCKLPETYPWSSHRAYLRPENAPPWLRVEEVLKRFGETQEFLQFVLCGNDETFKEFYSRDRQSPVLGGEKFLDGVRRRLHRVIREHPRYERARIRPAVSEVLGLVSQEYGIQVQDLIRGRRGRESEARKVAMFLVKRLCDLTLQETAERFGVGSYGVIGWACHAIRSKMDADRELKRKVEKIHGLVNQQKI